MLTHDAAFALNRPVTDAPPCRERANGTRKRDFAQASWTPSQQPPGRRNLNSPKAVPGHRTSKGSAALPLLLGGAGAEVERLQSPKIVAAAGAVFGQANRPERF